MMNIFTDASVIKTVYGETIGCAGAICLENNNICKFEIQRDSTNNISELTAIKLAIELAIENRTDNKINIWADSQWAIFGLTKWNRVWLDSICNNILISSSGQPVKNQYLFLSIMKLIVKNKIKINFYHIKGHINTNDNNSINHAISLFNKSNNTSISRDKMYIAANMNNMVDDQTRKLLNNFKNESRVYLSRDIINPIINKKDLNIYYNLVTLGGHKI